VFSFVETKKIFPRDDPFPESLARTDLPPPDCSESWHVLPCSASTLSASEKSSIMANRKLYTGFPTSHQPRFSAAHNFLKMVIKYLNLSSFIKVSTIKDDKSAAKFHYIKTVSGKVIAQSIAFRVVSIYWQGVAPFPWYLNAKGPTRHWKRVRCTHFASKHDSRDIIASLACGVLVFWLTHQQKWERTQDRCCYPEQPHLSEWPHLIDNHPPWFDLYVLKCNARTTNSISIQFSKQFIVWYAVKRMVKVNIGYCNWFLSLYS